MKISKITTYILRVALGNERFFSSQCEFPDRNSFLVKIETDSGLVGWGEGGQYGPPEPVDACVRHVLGPKLLGKYPLTPVKLWEEQYAATRDFGQKGAYIEALSAIDIALWDIYGKYVDQPIYSLLGGSFRDSIYAYATGCYYRGDDVLDHKTAIPKLAKEAKSYVDEGFTILKVKIGLLSIQADTERIGAIRDTVGEDTALLVDCNHAYNAHTAIRVGKAIEKHNVIWFEEPVVPEDRRGYKIVRDALSIPVTGGECEYTRYGFRDLITEGCVDIIQPDITVMGGISEFIKVHSLASSFGIGVVPHVWGSGVALATALHVLSTIPPFPHTANPIPLLNEPIVEFDCNINPLRDYLIEEKITLVKGRVPVPQGPGLGINIDEDILQKYCVSQKNICSD
jgi:D-galactarolactone cycloisomerase